MNSVSWFIYFADVFSKAGAAFAITTGGLVIVLGIGTLMVAIEESDFWSRGWKMLAPIILLTGTITVFIPGQNTMYAIAASEVGERVIKSEKAQEITTDATKALHQWIKKQIEPEKK